MGILAAPYWACGVLRTPVNGLWACNIPAGWTYDQVRTVTSICAVGISARQYRLIR